MSNRFEFKGSFSAHALCQTLLDRLHAIRLDPFEYEIYGANVYLNIVNKRTGRIVNLIDHGDRVEFMDTNFSHKRYEKTTCENQTKRKKAKKKRKKIESVAAIRG